MRSSPSFPFAHNSGKSPATGDGGGAGTAGTAAAAAAAVVGSGDGSAMAAAGSVLQGVTLCGGRPVLWGRGGGRGGQSRSVMRMSE